MQIQYEVIDILFCEDVFRFRVDRWGVTQLGGPLLIEMFSGCVVSKSRLSCTPHDLGLSTNT